jgi:hypothetical protein
MRHRNVTVGLVIVGVVAFAFFVPFIPMSGFPFFCWSNGHFGCVGGVVPGPPTIASISFRLFGYGGNFFQGAYQVTWP